MSQFEGAHKKRGAIHVLISSFRLFSSLCLHGHEIWWPPQPDPDPLQNHLTRDCSQECVQLCRTRCAESLSLLQAASLPPSPLLPPPLPTTLSFVLDLSTLFCVSLASPIKEKTHDGRRSPQHTTPSFFHGQPWRRTAVPTATPAWTPPLE